MRRAADRRGVRLAVLTLGVGIIAAASACGSDSGSSVIIPTSAGTTAPAPSTSSAVTPTVVDTTDTTDVTDTTGAPEPSTPSTVDPALTLAPRDIRLALVEVAAIESPIAIAWRIGDSTMYVTSQPGQVYAVRAGAEPTVVLDITSEVKSGGEQGLLGLVFSPDGSTAYVNYTLPDDSIQVESFSVADDGALDLATRKAIINIEHPGQSNHNGGHLAIGPDGMLYIGVGDGGGSGDPDRNALDLSSPLGKILRIDPRAGADTAYTLPTDNPFVGGNSQRGEVWSYGLRNPWRFSFDRLTGDLWIGDVGQNRVEEVNLVPAVNGTGAGRGANFGWSAYEGNDRFNKDQQAKERIKPIYEYRHHDKSASVTGGFVYRGTAVPGLYGAYVFGDAVLGTLWALRLDDEGKAVVAKVGYVSAVSSFGEDNSGELYALSLGDGKVYRITQAA